MRGSCRFDGEGGKRVSIEDILQSARGLISVVFGAASALAGHRQIEERVSRRRLAQRILAALLMTLAVWLFQRR